jgi:hypothetical protein
MGEHAAPRILDPRGEVVGEVRSVSDLALTSH